VDTSCRYEPFLIAPGKLPKSGSFIRPTRKPDPSRTLLKAVQAKYAPELLNNTVDGAVAKPVVFGTKIAEEIGFQKVANQQAQLANLSVIVVDGMGIEGGDKIESPELIGETIGKVRELDLSRNLFTDLEDIAKICIGLKNLRTLKLK
jgi:tubulin-specific chaperone E